ncbi:site-specific DNA-methyltransferase [Sphingomonas bacterium]|uniref:site-specific DNA-methyltransferase n=1 Tax=Sphingomonas bacterium TaxID=1895847 RepID=UPI001576CB1A|nr:DNA methyltransferase [Sphingomonas bacterium]
MGKASSPSLTSQAISPKEMFGTIDPIVFDAVEYVKPSQLSIRPGNPRVHTDTSVEAIARAVVATRVMTPIISDDANVIVAGEGRHRAALLLGLATVPVLRVAGLSEDQLQAFRLADNRVAELSSFDDTRLAVALKDFSSRDLGFNIEHLGFKHAEIDIRISGLDEPIDLENDAADLVTDVSGPVTSRLGDVWLCNRHRIVCGSALERSTYDALMRGDKAQMSIQDTVYNVSKNHIGGKGSIKHADFVMGNGEFSDGEFNTFLFDELDLAQDHCVKGAIIMAFMDWRSIDKLITAGKAAKMELINLCVWNKSNASMGSLYRSKHELIAVFKKPGARHRNNVMLGSYGRSRSNVWDMPGCNSFGKDRMTELSSHPTVKPVALIADAIRDVSNRDEIVLDSFLGSGTTIIAAERTSRIGYGIELDPIYVDTAVRRWEQYTGREALLEATGQSFAQVAADRIDPIAPPAKPQVSPRPRTRFVAVA